LIFVPFDFFLKRFDLVPGFQSSPHYSEIKFLHHEEILVHVQQHVSRDLLFLKYITVFVFYSELPQLFDRLSNFPSPHFFLRGLIAFLLIGLMAVDIRHPVIQVATVFTGRVIDGLLVSRWLHTVAWSAEIRNVLIDNTQSLVHDWALLTTGMGVECLSDGLLDIARHL
jgi:hypothetical protein